MKKLVTKGTVVGIGVLAMFSFVPFISIHAEVLNSHSELIMEIPENTVCHKIDYDIDTNRILPDSRTRINGEMYNEDTNPLYDLCIGSFPKYPSTSVEEGIFPFYYAKYTFIADPMPVYDIEVENEVVENGKTLKIPGIVQTFDMNEEIESYELPSDQDIFLFYPYNNAHLEAEKQGTALRKELRGPYQVGYNSFFHNTYRARYFASEVLFEFKIEEPATNDAAEQEKSELFSGAIYYKLEDECFRNDVLDYTDNCRDIEFYFPKSLDFTNTDKKYNEPYRGMVKENVSVGKNGDAESLNVIPKKRLHYNNPGTHTLTVTAEENLQLRFQKDLGTEYQTVGNESNTQGSNDALKATSGIVYFNREDTDNILTNIPKQIYSEVYKTGAGFNLKTIAGASATATDSGKIITKKDTKDHYYYDMEGNTDFLNYCDKDTGVWGDVNTDFKEGNATETDRDKQKDVSCYHNEGRDYRFWQYDWSTVEWYPANPWDNTWGF